MNMRGIRRAKIFKEKGVVIALVLCLVSIAAIAGVYVVEQGRQQKQNFVRLDEGVKKAADGKSALDSQEAATDRVISDDTNESEENQTEENNQQATLSTDKEEPKQEESKETAGTAAAPKFKEGDKLTWPVKGNVILDYSMDKTVFFSTLEQYKYNPGMLIAGAVNTKVIAAADGIVKSIKVNEETGNTVSVDLGGGFTAVYGQLKEIPIKEGASIKAGQTVGYISEPTKYYSVEGSNLYFQLLKNNKTVDPMNYLR